MSYIIEAIHWKERIQTKNPIHKHLFNTKAGVNQEWVLIK